MTVIQYRRLPKGITFNKTLQTNLPAFASFTNEHFVNGAVNIRENEESYTIEVIAPGFRKEDFKISLDKNILTIEANREEGQNKINYLLKEYSFRPLKRCFTVSENVDQERISANFVNGVLTLNLGRKDAVLKAKKEITIS